MKKVTLTVAAIAILFAACNTTSKTADTATTKPAETVKPTETPKPKVDCGSPAPTYAVEIKAIMAANCTSCHGYGGAGGYNFESIDDLQRSGKDGDLLGVIKWQKGFPKMPAHAPQLDAKTIAVIECWINGGMK